MDLIKGLKGLVKPQTKSLGYPISNWEMIGGMWIPYGDNVDNYINKGYKSVPYIYAIISHIIDKASDAPGQIMRIKDHRKAMGYKSMIKGARTGMDVVKASMLKNQAFDQISDHPFMELMENPNPNDTEKSLIESWLGYLLLGGNGYLYAAVPGIGKNATKPQQLWSLIAPTVEIVAGDRQNLIAGYNVSYFTEDTIPRDQIVHLKYFNPIGVSNNIHDMLYGLSPAKASSKMIGKWEVADIAEGTLFKNMGPAGLISGASGDNGLDEPTAIAIQDKFVQKHMGIYEAGKIIVTPADVKWTSIGVSPVDLNIIEAKKEWLKELCATYRYPEQLISADNSSYNNLETADRQLITAAVVPLLRRKDDALTQAIRIWYNDPSLVYVSDTAYYPELSKDKEKLSEWLGKAWWIKPNEKRLEMDYDQDDNPAMNEFLVPSGLTKINDITDGVDNEINNLAGDYEEEPEEA